MKYSSRLLFVLVVFFGVIVLTSCKPQQVGSDTVVVKNVAVALHVAGNPRQLNITSPADPGCKRSNVDGCVEAPQNEELQIDFRLTPQAHWRFVEFEICVGGVKADRNCNLNAYQQVEFGARLEEGSTIYYPDQFGKIDLTQISPDVNEDFTDFNFIDYNWVEQDYFYRIRVCPTGVVPTPDNTDCIWVDPPIENGGRGRNSS